MWVFRIRIVGPAQQANAKEEDSQTPPLVAAETRLLSPETAEEAVAGEGSEGGDEKRASSEEALEASEAAPVGQSEGGKGSSSISEAEAVASAEGRSDSQGGEGTAEEEGVSLSEEKTSSQTPPLNVDQKGASLAALPFSSASPRTRLLEAMVVFAKEGPLVSVGDAKAARPDGRPSVLQTLHLEILATVKELLKTSYFYKEHFEQVRNKHELSVLFCAFRSRTPRSVVHFASLELRCAFSLRLFASTIWTFRTNSRISSRGCLSPRVNSCRQSWR